MHIEKYLKFSNILIFKNIALFKKILLLLQIELFTYPKPLLTVFHLSMCKTSLEVDIYEISKPFL